MWAAVSLHESYQCHKWLTIDNHCAKQEALHHIKLILN